MNLINWYEFLTDMLPTDRHIPGQFPASPVGIRNTPGKLSPMSIHARSRSYSRRPKYIRGHPHLGTGS